MRKQWPTTTSNNLILQEVCTVAEEELILDETLKPGDGVKSDNAKSDHAQAEGSSGLEELFIVVDVADSDMEIL